MYRSFKLFRGLLGAALGACLFAGEASAGTATANLSVTATVSASCSISTTPLAFGTYDPVGAHAAAPLDATGGVVVTCTNGAATTVTLGQGSNANTGSSDATPLRRMASGGNFLSYSLYQNAGHTTVWGNTSGTGVAHTGSGTATSVSVYGRVPAGQNVASGSYADTVVATVTF
ncbi:MAG: SCPU domain-containing protein [Myxococcales bacterium]|nr:MAG: SCPU domain-containing protein [Myxococcales bacterium]